MVYGKAEKKKQKTTLPLHIHIFLTSRVLRGMSALPGYLDSQARFYTRMNTNSF